jgi:hypothetical protein
VPAHPFFDDNKDILYPVNPRLKLSERRVIDTLTIDVFLMGENSVKI